MRIKNFASLIILLNSLSCSNCSKQEPKSTKNEVGINNVAISKLESCCNFPLHHDVDEPLREIIKQFRDLYEYGTLFRKINKDQLDIVVNSVTNFLNKIKSKPGENIVDKVNTLKKIVDTYAEKIKESSSNNNDSNNRYQDFLKKLFIEHIERLDSAINNRKNIEEVADRFNSFISNYHSGKTFEISEQQQQTLESINNEFGKDCPINRIAKKVLENLTIIFDNNNDENKKIVDEIRTIFVDSKDQILTKDALSTITQKVNAKIITLYKNLVLQSVANIESCKNIFANLGFDILFSHELAVNVDSINEITNKTDIDRRQQFLKTYADSFGNVFDQRYNIICNPDDGSLCLAINDFDEGNLLGNISGLCNNGDESALMLGFEDGVGFIYINYNLKKSHFQQFGNQLLLTTADKIFENIQFINLGLSCGFNIKKNTIAPGTGGGEIQKTIQCDPDVLFKNIGDPYFGILDKRENPLPLATGETLENDGYKYFNYNRYNQVVSLFYLFDLAKTRWKSNKCNNDNRPFFSAAWFVHNVVNYILQSTDEVNIPDFPEVAKNILGQVYTKIKGDYENVKTYIIGDETRNKKIKLALVEYGVIHSGSFSENVHFDLGTGDFFKVRNDKGFGFENKMNTLAVWHQYLVDNINFDLKNINNIKTLPVNEIFDIDKTIIDGALVIYQATLNKHLNGNNSKIDDFIKFRNNFYSNYPKGILSTKDSVTFIKYVTDLAILRKKMTMLYHGHHTGNDILGKVIIELLNETYNNNVIYHAATCLVNKLGSPENNHLKFFKIKGVENTLKDHIMVNGVSDRANILIPQIDKVEDIESIDNLEISFPDSPYVEKANTIGLETVAYHIWEKDNNYNFNFNFAHPYNIDFLINSEDVIRKKIKKHFDAIKIYWYQIVHDKYKGGSDEKRGGVLYIGDNPETVPNDIDNKFITGKLNGFCIARDLDVLEKYAEEKKFTIDHNNLNFIKDIAVPSPLEFSGDIIMQKTYLPDLKPFSHIFKHFLALDNNIFDETNWLGCRLFDFDYQGSIDLEIYKKEFDEYGREIWNKKGTVKVPNFGYR